MTKRPRLRVLLAFALALYLMIEGVALGGLYVLRETRGHSYFPMGSTLPPEAKPSLDSLIASGGGARTKIDPELGWVLKQGPQTNSVGMRDDREYDPEPTPGILRISAFGDSYTYGSDVKLGENWTKRIAAINPAIEVLNYGIGGYGLDQGYLRYLRLGANHHPHVVFIGYLTENLARNVNVFRGFYTTSYRNTILAKPRFRVENGKLVLIPNPLATIDDFRRLRDHADQVLPELGRNDYHYVDQYRAGPLDFSPSVRLAKMVVAKLRKIPQIPIFTSDGRYETRSEAYDVTLRIFDAYYRKVLEEGALPVIIVLPDFNDQKRSREGQSRRYEPMLEYFRSKGYRYIDGLGALQPVEDRYTYSDLSGNWGHFTKLGNDLVARYILENLDSLDVNEPSKAIAAAAAERQRLGIAAPTNRRP